MPGLDRTGPEGQGPRTGRSLGKCNPESKTSDEQILDEDQLRGRGRGAGRGLKRGFGGGQTPGRRRGQGRWFRR